MEFPFGVLSFCLFILFIKKLDDESEFVYESSYIQEIVLESS